mgnify:CR=1 FL=1
MKMTRLCDAITETERFLTRAQALKTLSVGCADAGNGPAQSAVIRASLDLTRALAQLRGQA